MNSRLTEIYRSSRSQEGLASQDEYKSANVLLGSEVAKFAELIVRECTNIVEDAVNHREPASSYVGKIKQHFGVEE